MSAHTAKAMVYVSASTFEHATGLKPYENARHRRQNMVEKHIYHGCSAQYTYPVRVYVRS